MCHLWLFLGPVELMRDFSTPVERTYSSSALCDFSSKISFVQIYPLNFLDRFVNLKGIRLGFSAFWDLWNEHKSTFFFKKWGFVLMFRARVKVFFRVLWASLRLFSEL